MAEIAAIGLFILAVGLGGGWLSYRLRMRGLLKDLERHLAEIAHNRWRRGDDGEPAPNTTELGRTLDAAVDALRKLTTAGQAQESYEGVIDCRTCVHLGPMKDCTAPFGCAGGAGFERRSALQLWGRAHG